MKKIIILVLLGLSCVWYHFPNIFEANVARELLFHFIFFLIIGSIIKNIWVKIFYYVVTILTFYICIIPAQLMFMKLYYYYNFAIAVIGYQLFINYFKNENIDKILNWICIIALINVGMAYLQVLGVSWIFHPRAPIATGTGVVVHGFMNNPNHFAALIGICLPCFFRKKWIWFLIVLIPILFFKNNTVSHTRGGMLLVAFVCLYFIAIKFNGHIDKLWVAILCVLVFLNISFLLYRYVGDTLDGDRFEVWKSTLKTLNKNTIKQGYGIGMYKIIRPSVDKGAVEAHNEPIQVTWEIGITGLLPLIGLVIQTRRRFWKYKDDKNIQIIFCGLCCVGINCLTNFTFHQVALMILAGGLLVLWEIVIERKEQDGRLQCV